MPDHITQLLASSPTHLWEMKTGTDFADSVGSATLTSNSIAIGTNGICRGVATAGQTDGTSDRFTAPDQADMNSVALDRMVRAGWFMVTAIQDPPVCVYHEGDTTNMAILIGWGNTLMFQAKDASLFINQVFGDRPLANNRPYHLAMKFSGSAFDDEFTAWLDGVELVDAEPADKAIGQTSMAAHPVIEWGDVAAGAGGMQVGPNDVLLVSAVDSFYNVWASWNAGQAQAITTTEVRELFEVGALADLTISSDTEANMQIALDAIASTVRPDYPICIRVEDVTGEGDLTLIADDVTFDPLASVHIQWVGAGTLTWRNENGSNASIASTPNSGTVTFENETTLTINGLQNPTEVRAFIAGTETEVAGQENVTTGTVSLNILADSVDVSILSLGYENQRILGLGTTADLTIQVTQFVDRQYENA